MSNFLTVVMYHYVRRIKGSRYPGIKGLEFDLFIEQLGYIKRNYHVVTMEDVIRCYRQQAKLPDNAMLLTFDDAYVDHFNHVYPVLKEFGMQGSFFVPVKSVVENKVLDVNKVHFVLSSCDDIMDLVRNLKDKIDRQQQAYSLKSFDQYFNELAVANRFDAREVIFVKRMLQHALPEELRNAISDELFHEYIGMDEAAFSRELYMDRHQLKQLVADGMHVGCHGYEHYWWNNLTPEALDAEIDKSVEFLRELGCDLEAWTASYPYGSYSDAAVSALQAKGCKLAFTSECNVADLRVHHPLLLPRLDTNDLPMGSEQ